MANELRLKRNSIAGVAPTASDLLVAEPAYNGADGLLFFKNSAGEILTYAPIPTVTEATGSFTAAFGVHYGLHMSGDVTVTFPAWVQGRSFTVSIDGVAGNDDLIFVQPTGEEVNGSTGNKTVGVHTSGNLFTILCSGDSGDKHWVLTKSEGV